MIANILALRCIAFRTLTPSSLARLLPALLGTEEKRRDGIEKEDRAALLAPLPASDAPNTPRTATNEQSEGSLEPLKTRAANEAAYPPSEEASGPFQALEPFAAPSPAELAPSDPLFFLFGRRVDAPPVFGASLEALAAHAPLESLIARAKGLPPGTLMLGSLRFLCGHVLKETRGFLMPCLTLSTSHGKVGGGTPSGPSLLPRTVRPETVINRTPTCIISFLHTCRNPKSSSERFSSPKNVDIEEWFDGAGVMASCCPCGPVYPTLYLTRPSRLG